MLRRVQTAVSGPNVGNEEQPGPARSARMATEVDQEALTTLHFVSQVEAIVAEGPHGRLDEYLQVVDLLFNAKALFERAQFSDGLRQTRQLLATAMGDLEFEFKDMLERRSNQAATRLTKEELKALSNREPEAPAPTDVRIGDIGLPAGAMSAELGGGGAGAGAVGSRDVANGDMGVASELLPPATVRWLAQIAERMRMGQVAPRCCEVYRLVRSDFLKACFRTMKTYDVCELSVENMPWEILEKTCKEWITQMRVMVDVLLIGEFDLCSRVLDGQGADQGKAFAEIVRQVAVVPMLKLIKLGQEISSKRLPEQLFAMLDMYSAIEDLTGNVAKAFCGPGGETVVAAWGGLAPGVAQAALSAFDQLRTLLLEATSQDDHPRVRRLLPGFLRGSRSDSSEELLPRGGAVHTITSYVVNYIRGYLHRLGKRNYVKVLEKVFRDYGDKGTTTRTVDRETATLVMVLRKFLDVKATLYKDEALQALFLMNNINYLFRSMLLWHGWHGRGLLHALTAAKREGNREVQLALTDLQDNRIVSQYSDQFQRAALEKIVSILGDPVSDRRRGSVEQLSETEVRTKLKKFKLAFDELCIRQQEWTVPDDELRTIIRGHWCTLIKERYRRMLLPYWDSLTQSKYYVFPIEDIELKIMRFFTSN